MKHFIVEFSYTVDADNISHLAEEHKSFLQEGYEKGWLLMSGPIVPKTGGMIIARNKSVDDLREYFRRDPYAIKGLAKYRFVEFVPVKHQNLLESWASISG